MSSRRRFLKSSLVGGAGLGLANVSGGAETKAESAPRHFRIGIPAYSFKEFLPNYRGGKVPGETPMKMAGFLEHCATLDVEAAEVTSYFLEDPCPRTLAFDLKRKAHELGLEISGGAISNNFTFDPSSEELAKQMAYTEGWISTYAAMGAPVVRVFAGRPKSKKMDRAVAEENVIKNLQAACATAGNYGVILGLENHDFTTDIDRMVRIVEAVDSPWFGVNFDSGNLEKTADPYADLKRIAPGTVNAQIKTEIPRNGKKEPADFKRIVDILGEAGFRGTLVLEYEGEDPYGELPKYIAKLREAIG